MQRPCHANSARLSLAASVTASYFKDCCLCLEVVAPVHLQELCVPVDGVQGRPPQIWSASIAESSYQGADIRCPIDVSDINWTAELRFLWLVSVKQFATSPV